MKITIAPLSARQSQTFAAMEAVKQAEKLFLQTELHPFSMAVQGLSYTAMDDLYAESEDFDELQEAIAHRLLASEEDCVYAVTGETGALLDVLLPLAKQRDVSVEVLSGVPLAYAAFPMANINETFAATALPARLDAALSVAVTEIDTALRAGEVKLVLSEYYPDDWPVQLAQLNADGAFEARSFPLCELDRQKKYDAATVLFVPAVSFDALTRYGMDELMTVVARLRAPGGCPWDREQTHESMRAGLVEECYEVLDAIEQEDDDALVEELGDVLLQVAMHAEIAKEQGRFTERDVATGIVQKLIYRHPHVFGDVQVGSSDEVLVNWDKLKMAEKKQETLTDTMLSIPKGFPALIRSRKVQKKAAKVGFDWDSAEDAFFKISEETQELREAMQSGEGLFEELGDLLFAVVNVARLLDLDPEFALRAATDKFIDRFAAMEALATEKGLSLSGMTLQEMDKLWDAVKKVQKQA